MYPISFSLDGDGSDRYSEIACPKCRSFLTVHLPDPQMPERMLGTCDRCKSWYLMDCETSMMVLLPDERGPE